VGLSRVGFEEFKNPEMLQLISYTPYFSKYRQENSHEAKMKNFLNVMIFVESFQESKINRK